MEQKIQYYKMLIPSKMIIIVNISQLQSQKASCRNQQVNFTTHVKDNII